MMSTPKIFLEEDAIPNIVQLEDVTTDSNDTSLTNDVSPGMRKKKREKSLFLPLTQMDETNTPLFLLNTNKKDLHLLRVLTLKLPWEASHGNKCKAWDTVADLCMEQKDEEGSMVFSSAVLSQKTVKERFKVLMKWVKDENSAAQYRSGTDDEKAPNEILDLLNNIFEMYQDWELHKDESSKDKADTKRRNRDAAAEIRAASLSGQTKADLKEVDQNGKKTKRSVEVDDSTVTLDGLLKLECTKLEETPKKEDLTERKLILNEKKLKMEEERFNLEREERKLAMEERRIQIDNEKKRNEQTIQMVNNSMEIQKQLMEMIMKMNNK
mgnify:FL=1